MLKIALTGGIGSGKSTVAGFFQSLGADIIDADQVARDLVVPGSSALGEIAALFGPEAILPNGTLNRPWLRCTIFADAKRRLMLENVLHHRIFREIRLRIQGLQGPYGILVIPLLLETGETAIADRILVVDAPPSLQKTRVLGRDGLRESDVVSILNSQVGRAERLRAADDILTNQNDLAILEQRVRVLHHYYLALATNRSVS